MKKLLLWITLLLSCPLLYAHGHNHDDHEHQPASNQPLSDAHISGDVRDANTGEHLPYVYVTLKNKGIGGLTDASGHFYITNVPTGKTIVEFSMLGYETIEYTLTLNPDGGTLEQTEIKFTDYTKVNLPTDITKEGYTFNGWNTTSDGVGTTYANNATVSNLVSENNGEITL